MSTVDFVTMIRTKEWKLVQFLDEPFGQLFDLKNDPAEEINLWDVAEHSLVKAELQAEIGEFRIRSGYKTRTLWQNDR